MTEKKETPKEKLLKQQAKIKARLVEIAIKEKNKERKIETRKKIVLGGALLALQKRGEDISMVLNHIRETASDRDKKLFEEKF